jgi:nucleoside-diphosphate-sugar epimerase
MNDDLYLITGGAGFMGINLVRYLLARGQRIRSLDIAAFDYPEKADVDVVTGDVRDRATVEATMAGVTRVVHCAAALPLYSTKDIVTTEVDGTRIVLESAMKQGVPRVIHVSSTAVYGIPDHHPIYEHDKLHGVGAYGQAKIDAEQLCRTFRDKGMCVTVLRPKSFIGPERLGVFELLYEWASEGRNFPVLGPGTNRYQLLDVEDLCQAVHLCATGDEGVVNDTFNVGAKLFTTLKEDFQAVLDHAGHGKRIVCLPVTPVVATLRVLAALRLSPLYKWIYETVAQDSFVSIEKIERALGFSPRYSNKEALIRNYVWYVEHRDEITGRSGVSHRTPWKRGALALAKGFF